MTVITSHRSISGLSALLILAHLSLAAGVSQASATDLIADCGSSPGGDTVEIDVTDVPADRVLRELIRVKHLQIQHAERIGSGTVSFHFSKCVPVLSLLNILASDSEMVAQRDGNGGYRIEQPNHPKEKVELSDFDRGQAAYRRRDYAGALKIFRASAQAGEARSQWFVGAMYENGDGLPQDYGQAAYWYRKAADQGAAEGENGLGAMYANGEGVPRDDAQAAVWFRKAADQGLAYSQYNLGRLYLEGKGVPKDDAQAQTWLRKAAVQGLAQAESLLCEKYRICTPREDAEVALTESETKGLEQESAKRDYEASVMLRTGKGLPRDDAKALQLLRRAADKGNLEAQCTLGSMYADGTLVQKDRVQAYAYLKRASALDGSCKGKLSDLQKHMTPEELSRAKDSMEQH